MIPVFTFITSHRHVILRGVSVVAFLLLLVVVLRGLRKPAEVIHVDPVTKVVFIPRQVIAYRDIVKYIPKEDQGIVKRALDSAKNNGTNVDQINVGRVDSSTFGEGTITVTTTNLGTSTPFAFTPFEFTDGWRLRMKSDGVVDPVTHTVKGTYELKQQFVITNTIGRDRNNLLTSEIKLFELDPQGKQRELDTTSSYTVATKTSDQRPRAKFYVKPTLQGGVAVLPSVASTAEGGTTSAFSVGIPWWKRGTARAVETTRYAYLTPTATLNNADITVGITPVSFNIGTVKHLPVTDLWASPYVGVSLNTNQKKFGVVFSTTF